MRLLTSLMPHQESAADKLAPLRVGALFMDMGTGKSRTAIELAYRRAGRCRRVLWFVPVSLIETTRREVLKHVADTTVRAFKESTRLGKIPEAHWYIIGIESMSTSRRTLLAAASLVDDSTMMIVDESSYIKNHRALRTKWIQEVGKKAKWRLLLTGTPITLGVVDLFAQMFFLSPEILGYTSFYSFAANHLEYAVKKFSGGREVRTSRVVRAHNTGYLAAKIAPYTYQVSKDECLDLPAKLYGNRWVSMARAQADLYARAKEKLLGEMDSYEGDFDSALIYRLFSALQQAACGFWNEYPVFNPDRRRGDEPRQPIECHRVDCNRRAALVDVLSSLEEGEKAIVWVKFIEELEGIKASLEAAFGVGCTSLFYGALSGRRRQEELDAWKLESVRRFFVATPQTGGHGLTLNESAFTVFYTDSFNLAHRLQAEDRNHRIGQDRHPTYISILMSGTIDERIASNLASKGQVMRDFHERVKQSRDQRSIKAALAEFLRTEKIPEENS